MNKVIWFVFIFVRYIVYVKRDNTLRVTVLQQVFFQIFENFVRVNHFRSRKNGFTSGSLKLQVYKREGFSHVEVYKRVGKSVI